MLFEWGNQTSRSCVKQRQSHATFRRVRPNFVAFQEFYRILEGRGRYVLLLLDIEVDQSGYQAADPHVY